MAGHERFAVCELSTLVAGPDQESERCKKSYSINTNVPGAQKAAEKDCNGEPKSAPHMADDEVSVVATAPCEKPAKKDRDKGANAREEENKARQCVRIIPSAREADAFQKRDEQQECNRKMNDERMKASDELIELSVFDAVGWSMKQCPR